MIAAPPMPARKRSTHDLTEPRHGGAEQRGDTGPQAAQHDHAQLALRIAERTDHELEQAVGESEGGDDRARTADR